MMKKVMSFAAALVFIVSVSVFAPVSAVDTNESTTATELVDHVDGDKKKKKKKKGSCSGESEKSCSSSKKSCSKSCSKSADTDS